MKIFKFRKIFTFLFLLSHLYSNCLSFDSSDSLLKRFPEVNVISSKLSNNSISKFYPIFKIDYKIIQNKMIWQISEIIDISPGLFVKDYGGLGGLKTISLRGTTASQTLILLDGMKLNSIQNGIVDLSVLPTSFLKDIEVFRSGSSAINGDNALGGCINIITSIESIDTLNIKAYFNYGIYNDIGANFSLTIPIDNITISTTSEIIKSSGKYPFISNQFGQEKEFIRENADFNNFITILASNVKIKNWKTNSRLLFRCTDRGSPGAVVQGNIENSNARLKEKEAIFINSLKNIFSNGSSLSFGLNLKYNEMQYKDSSLIALKESNYYSSEINLNANYFIWLFGIKTNFLLEGNIYWLNGDNIINMNSRTVDRINMAGSIVNEIPFEINEWILNILGAIRLDFYSDLNWFWGLTTGINIENPRIPLSFRGQFSTNYRMPSFNELYYFNYGSKDLKPEKSISSNFGLSLEFFSNLKLNIDAYYINTVDQIVSVPKSPIVWNATNIGKVVTKGIEISSSISLFDSLFKFSLAYTLQNAIDESENSLTKGKLIPYIPQEMIKATAFCNLDKLTFIISADYNSFRFSLPDNSYNSLLPAFFTIDLSGNYQFNLWKSKINLIFTIKNLLNTRYSIIMNYPMPGIIIRGGVGLEL